MLRKKFMVVLGIIVTLHVVMALQSILALHGVLRDLDAAGAAAVASTTAIQRAKLELNAAQVRSSDLPPQATVPARDLASLSGSLDSQVRAMNDLVLMEADGPAGDLAHLHDQVRQLAADAGPVPVSLFLDRLVHLRDQVDRLEISTSRVIEEARQDITSRFRRTIVVLGVVFVLIINATLMVLSRMVGIIVRPVDRLVEGSRRLAREEFSHRVDLGRPRRWSDEFAELADAHNALAAQLEQNEQRKVEMMHQVARTLSHELNNAIAIIELQITHLARQTRGDESQAERLREIHRTLARISRTIDSLMHVRRIVLTDYTSGVSMLDLERSTEEVPGEVPIAAGR
ncbi:MAG: HAMP domain-containing protein [Phycisphaeraceae bacterium]|nr:HAMP domain-containing protein [Phycisphaeraceae bacterium]